MDKIFSIIAILLGHFFDPKQVKKREEKKIEKETDKLSTTIDKHINDLDSSMLASDLDELLTA